jgi:hypothetical protein
MMAGGGGGVDRPVRHRAAEDNRGEDFYCFKRHQCGRFSARSRYYSFHRRSNETQVSSVARERRRRRDLLVAINDHRSCHYHRRAICAHRLVPVRPVATKAPFSDGIGAVKFPAPAGDRT